MAKKSSTVRNAGKGSAGKQKARVETRQVKIQKGTKSGTVRRATQPAATGQIDIKRQLKIQKALYEIADAASAVKDMQSFYKKLHKIVGKLMYAETFFVTLLEPSTQIVTYEFVADATLPDPIHPQKLNEEPGFTEYVLSTGKSLHASREIQKNMVKQGRVKLYGKFSEDWIGVPLKSGTGTFGALVVQSFEKDFRYSDEDVTVLEFVAQHIATALTRARAIEAERQRAAELAIVNSIQQGLAAQLDIQSIYDLVGEKIREMFKEQAQTVFFAFYDPATDLTQFPYNYQNGKVSQIKDWKPDIPIARRQIESRETIFVRTVAEVEQYGMTSAYARSAIFVPFLRGGELHGVLGVLNTEREFAFTESHVRLLETLANSMSVALQNAQSFKAEQERVAELQIINSIQQGLAAELDFQSIVDLVGDKLREIIAADNFGILLYDPKSTLANYPYAVFQGKRITLPADSPGGISGHVLKTGQTLVFNRDFAEKSKQYNSTLMVGQEYPKSGFYIPIKAGNNVIGVISAQNYTKEDAYPDSLVRLLEIITANMGVALENARLFDETQRLFKAEQERVAELQIINSIQQGLAAELDFQAIVDLVGDKLREVFSTPDLSISWYDEKALLLHYLYTYEHGERLTIQPRTPQPGGIFETQRKTRQPVVFNSIADYEKYNATVLPGTDQGKSFALYLLLAVTVSWVQLV